MSTDDLNLFNPSFLQHAQLTWNVHFRKIDTLYHFTALYLHLLGKKLALDQVATCRTIADVNETPLKMAQGYRYGFSHLDNILDGIYVGPEPVNVHTFDNTGEDDLLWAMDNFL